MGRGRRTRAVNSQANTILANSDDQCASPKRKEYKNDNKNLILKTVLARDSLDGKRSHVNLRNGRVVTRDISTYFPSSNKEKSVIDLTDDNTCGDSSNDDFPNKINIFPKNSIFNNFIGTISQERNEKQNLFLQEPVLSLKIEQASNVASSLVIRNNFGFPQKFGSTNCFLSYKNESEQQIDENLGTPLDLSKPTQVTKIDSTTFLNSDSNSCDSGVVIDKTTENNSDNNAYRKPITPHRILCPSPIKECQPSTPQLPKYEKEVQKKIVKSKKRLNVDIENLTAIHKKENTIVSKSGIRENKTLTEYFQLRRSVRKTKKEVQEERLKSIEQAVIHGKEDGLEMRVFGEKGRGIVTKRFFNKGEFVVEYIGELISSSEAQVREEEYAKDLNTGCYMYYFKHKNQQYCIDATAESGKLGRLVNHSRNGNLIPRTMVIKNVPRLVLFAKEDIACGDEITYDYGDRSKESLIHHPWLAL